MFDEKERYVIENYQAKPPFSSFLPGIAGPMGVPVWCYYNNRGQAVCSFGAQDKDHAIMEFSPAYCAYRDVKTRGFRTFGRINGEYAELFSGGDMHIGVGELEITTKESGMEASVVYFGIPHERTAALARMLTITNVSDHPLELEILDGMPEVVPYGVDQDALKNMTQLATAWMRVEDADKGLACYKVRASMADTAWVTEVKGCNFCLSWDGVGSRLSPLADQRLVFGEDTAFERPDAFAASGLDAFSGKKQSLENAFPCCFFPLKTTLAPGEQTILYSLYGQAGGKEEVQTLAGQISGAEWFLEKRRQAAELIGELTSAVRTKTADPVFDGYCRQTYLDNLLRGGVAYFFESGGKRVPFYLYSRKHGDPEREYNYFSLGGEYFAQGNGNYRDVNQNRRCDVRFAPELGERNIRTFYELIQPDGYNPLVLTAEKYLLSPEGLNEILGWVPAQCRGRAEKILSQPFTPGAFAMEAEEWGLSKDEVMKLTAETVCSAFREPEADFSEGYWCDHWTYNLDLIENYLAVYPERERSLLFGNSDYRWYAPRATVNPRTKRYRKTADGLRQYHALTELESVSGKWVRTAHGDTAHSTLIEKLLLLCTIKTAALDAAGMGIEMEGGKPGWYDALNGLPGLFGSSMPETCELLRLIRFVKKAVKRHGLNVELFNEIRNLFFDVAGILEENSDPYVRWDLMNRRKEEYRAAVSTGFSGQRLVLETEALLAGLNVMEQAAEDAVHAAMSCGENGVIPTYFTYTAEEITDTEDGPLPKKLTPSPLPLFLEGPVHWMKLPFSTEEKRKMAEQVKNSGLYDRKLCMYKVNESLEDVSFEAGRAKAFTPGWLENESIWLHMEYKYLLELLRSGLYEEFSGDFRKAAVPFLDPARYGRSPLENVSFLASSANPNPSRWGRGYVARLSGSTAEFLEIWQLMFFGKQPFSITENGLNLCLEPLIPDYLIPESGEIDTVFLGTVPVTYRILDRSPHTGRRTVEQWTLTLKNGKKQTICAPFLPDEETRLVRGCKVAEMQINLK